MAFLELEQELEINIKHKLLVLVKGILPSHVSCMYICQTRVLDLGHAVLCAQPAASDELFAVVFGG